MGTVLRLLTALCLQVPHTLNMTDTATELPSSWGQENEPVRSKEKPGHGECKEMV